MANVDIDAGIEAAIMVGKSSHMDTVARRVESLIKARAASHRLTGAYIASVRVDRVRGQTNRGVYVTDRLISVNDPAAWSIEYGHYQGKRGTPDRKHVPGLRIMTRAYAAVGS